MKKILTVLLAAAIIMTAIQCSESGSSTSSPRTIDAASLFGLENDRTLTYLQTDTVVNIDFSIDVDVDYEIVTITGDEEDWIVQNGDDNLLNLKLTDQAIILNGHWYDTGGQSLIKYFAVPPILMDRSLRTGDSWQGYTPHYFNGLEDATLLWYYGYFGFYFTKEYLGRETLQLPAGTFDAYQFEVGLYRNPVSGEPDILVYEYFVPDLGLVQLNLRGAALNRTLSLISYQ